MQRKAARKQCEHAQTGSRVAAVGEVAEATRTDAERAIEAARTAFDEAPRRTHPRRVAAWSGT